jgi:ribosomal protein S18 acetylase RimI-like enzyme
MPQIIKDYRHDPALREAFYRHTQRVFPGINFRRWQEHGHWSEDYMPHSILEGEQMIANASVTRMKLWLEGNPIRGLQIGTVGTLPEFRNRGLARLLMEHVMDTYAAQAELIFLFTNETVLDFYPKFGFRPVREVVFVATENLPVPQYQARKLDISREQDMALVGNLISGRDDPTRLFGAGDFGFITWFYILNGFDQRLYYLEHEDILFILSEKEGRVHVWDAISPQPFDMAAVLPKVAPCERLESVHYYFSPDRIPFSYDRVVAPEDSYLFVRGRFPLDGRLFKFPFTAQT